MKKQTIKKIIFLTFIVALIISPEMISATKYILCGEDKRFPYVIANLVSTFMSIIKIAVPILLVISGMISFMKVTFSSNVEEDLKKAKTKLINSIIAAVIIFFIVSVANFAVGLVAGKDNQFMSCVNCFINPEKCETTEEEENELCPGFIGEECPEQES